MIQSKYLFSVLCFIALSSASHGAPSETMFETVKVIDQVSEDNRLHFLPLGRIKKDRASGRDLPTHYKRLSGRFNSTVWELVGGQSLEEVRQQASASIEQPKFEVLFQCKERDCGESFAWANSIFKQPILYGNDRSQSLWVVKDIGAPRYHLFYLIERPNRRIYFYEETLFVPEQALNQDAIAAQLKNQGRVIIGGLSLQNLSEEISAVVAKLGVLNIRHEKLLLVVHRHGDEALALNDKVTTLLKAELAEQGVQSKGIWDVANLAPNSESAEHCWVELVNPDWVPQ